MPTLSQPTPTDKILTRIAEIEWFIQAQAYQFNFGDRSLTDDLAQEARVKLWQELTRRPDAPRPHLFNWVKKAVWHYRVRGKSIDVLNQRTRKRQYKFVPYDPYHVPNRPGPARPTENAALINLYLQGALS